MTLVFCVHRPVKEELPDLLNNRSNVFDDDEFDVFRRDQVDMSRIWKGRRYSRRSTTTHTARPKKRESPPGVKWNLPLLYR